MKIHRVSVAVLECPVRVQIIVVDMSKLSYKVYRLTRPRPILIQSGLRVYSMLEHSEGISIGIYVSSLTGVEIYMLHSLKK